LIFPNSKHNKYPSLAVDLAPYPINWNNKAQFIYFAGYVMRTAEILKLQGKIKHSLLWGGDWNRNLNPSK